MAKDYAKKFYKSKEWQKCRNGYMQSKHFICERCGGIATICHHKNYISEKNINNPNITLNCDNLEAVCQDCHNNEHQSGRVCAKGLRFDDNGNLVKV